jgi:release factor glutamine methyltransferase
VTERGASGRTWTVREALDWTTGYFTQKDVEAPRRSAEWLLSEATGLTRVELYAYHDRPLTPEERDRLRDLVRARAAGTPLQYVTGEVCFRHLVLKVRPGVFIPRPETEVLVDIALARLADDDVPAEPIVVDCCTGSGAVALSIALEMPAARVWATEIEAEVAAVARDNAERCGLADRVTVLEGDLLRPLPEETRGAVTALVANPPYVPSADIAGLPPEVGDFEPLTALDGGLDGLAFARSIMVGARDRLAPGGLLAMELDTDRCKAAAAELEALGYEEVTVRADLTGRDRVVTARHVNKGGDGP